MPSASALLLSSASRRAVAVRRCRYYHSRVAGSPFAAAAASDEGASTATFTAAWTAVAAATAAAAAAAGAYRDGNDGKLSPPSSLVASAPASCEAVALRGGVALESPSSSSTSTYKQLAAPPPKPTRSSTSSSAAAAVDLRRARTASRLQRHATTAYSSQSRYKIGKLLGEGTFGTVHLATDRFTGEKVALKRIHQEFADDETLGREMDAMMRVREKGGHPHICGLRENFIEGENYVLVLDLIEGGEMFDHLIENGAYSELDASRLVREVAGALAFMHGIGVVHADIKPENIMLSSKRATECVIKVVDFGSAEVRPMGDDYREWPSFTGVDEPGVEESPFIDRVTPSYSPPEVIDSLMGEDTTSRIDSSLDMWSLGVILYIMLVGAHPFDPTNDASEEEVEDRIHLLRVPELDPAKDDRLAHLSPAAIDLLTKLLAEDPSKRLTAQQMLAHPWVIGTNARRVKMREVNHRLAAFQGLRSEIEKTVFERLIEISGRAERKRLGVQEETEGKNTSLIEKAFRSFDRGGKGHITKDDVAGANGGGEAVDGGEEHSLTLTDFADIVSESMHNRYFPAGKVVYEEGDTGDHMYFIDSGTVEILTKDGFRATRGHGSTFGEGAMFHPESKRSATVRCKTPVHALEVNRDCFMRHLGDKDARSQDLQLGLRERTKKRTFGRAGALLSQRQDLDAINLKQGDKVFGDGEGADAVFGVDSGTVEVRTDGGKVVFTARRGDLLGLSSIFMDRLHKEEAVCTDPAGCIVRAMAAKDFQEAMDASPGMEEALKELFLRREIRRAVVLKMDASFPGAQGLREAFDAIDTDGSGELDKEEVRELLRLLDDGISEENIEKAIKSLDLDESGCVDFEEFRRIFAKDQF